MDSVMASQGRGESMDANHKEHEVIKDAAMRDRIEQAAKANAAAEHLIKDHVAKDQVKDNKVESKVEDKFKLGIAAAAAPTARQQIVLDALSGHQLDIMELFKRNGMDSQDQIHAWRDLVIMFTPS